MSMFFKSEDEIRYLERKEQEILDTCGSEDEYRREFDALWADHERRGEERERKRPFWHRELGKHLAFIESAINYELGLGDHPPESPFFPLGSITTEDGGEQEAIGRSSRESVVFLKDGPSEWFRWHELDLKHALAHLRRVREALSKGLAARAVLHMYYATAFAAHGEAELLSNKKRRAVAGKKGKLSGVARRRKASRAWSVLDWYLDKAVANPADGTKTRSAKAAQRKLSRHCELWYQASDGDELAAKRFSDEAAPGLAALLADGWTPPQWRTLYDRHRSK